MTFQYQASDHDYQEMKDLAKDVSSAVWQINVKMVLGRRLNTSTMLHLKLSYLQIWAELIT
jgi:hypothetical protein